MVTFELSVGDFVVVGGLIRKVSKALKDSGVATSEYQDVMTELESLSMILRHLETLRFTETVQASYANPIRRLGQNWQVPLEAFLERIESFKESLGVRSQRNNLGNTPRRVQWAMFLEAEVPKLRAAVAAKVLQLQLLLQTRLL